MTSDERSETNDREIRRVVYFSIVFVYHDGKGKVYFRIDIEKNHLWWLNEILTLMMGGDSQNFMDGLRKKFFIFIEKLFSKMKNPKKLLKIIKFVRNLIFALQINPIKFVYFVRFFNLTNKLHFFIRSSRKELPNCYIYCIT